MASHIVTYVIVPPKPNPQQLFLLYLQQTKGSYFISTDGSPHYYFGHGTEKNECSCGADEKCGGYDGSDAMADR